MGERSLVRAEGLGWSYIANTLTFSNPEAFSENAPYALTRFLNCDMQAAGSGEPEPPKSCEPLARAMMESKTPILRLTGLWWIGDFETFAVETYEHVDRGDVSLLGLQVSAAERDPDPLRAVERLIAARKHRACPEGIIKRLDETLFIRGGDALRAGIKLDKDLPYIRESLTRTLNLQAIRESPHQREHWGRILLDLTRVYPRPPFPFGIHDLSQQGDRPGSLR